jgi:transposase
MTNSGRIAELKQKIKHLKKTGNGGSDFRLLLRLMALVAYYQSQPVERIALLFNISGKSLKRWIKLHESIGIDFIKDTARSGRPSKLDPDQQAQLKNEIQTASQRVWVARHIVVTIYGLYGVLYSVRYLPQLLNKLGLGFHKAMIFLVKRDSEKRRIWIQETLPKLYQKKIDGGWRIFYQDEVGFQTEGTLAYTWGIRGQPTQIPNYGRHGRMNMMGAFELGTGLFYGVQTSFKVNAMRFRRFICHLKREMRTDKILLVCDNASFHKAKWLTAWVETQKTWLSLAFLPPYSPDFNPIERLWRWMKTEYTHNQCWASKEQLKKRLQVILQEIPAKAESIKTVMKKENERYQKICEFYQTGANPLFGMAT